MIQPVPEPAESATPQSAAASLPEASKAARVPLMTAVACVACVIVFVGLTARGDSASWERLARWGYLAAPRVWGGGYWALLTSVFVHLAAWHRAFNV